jgi:RimJ/RimL family protein N-acetyltransferase
LEREWCSWFSEFVAGPSGAALFGWGISVKFLEAYFGLWTKAFGLPVGDLTVSGISVVSSGYYVQRHQDNYVFLYFDEQTGKLILAGSEKSLAVLKGELGDQLSKLNYQNVRGLSWFKDRELVFKNIDFCFSDSSEFIPFNNTSLDIRELSPANQSEIDELYLDCSEDDKDTLDLTFEDEVAFGVYDGSKLIGISRYAVVRDTKVADITIVIRQSYRGKGYSSGLVSRVVETALRNGLVPKYRVDESNHASIAIAKKLGFSPRFHVLAWGW